MRIDFRDLKRRIRLTELLGRIGWTSTEGRGVDLRGPCPLPACSSRAASGSKSARRSFSVHTGKNVYNCFDCGSQGTVIDFWRAYRGQSLMDSAIELATNQESGNPICDIEAPLKPQLNLSHPAKTVRS